MSQSFSIQRPAAGLAQSRGGFVLQPGRGNFLDEFLAIAAFIILPLDFPAAQPLRVPFTVLLVGYAALHWREWLPLLVRGKWLFILPVVSILSALWAANSGAAIKHGSYIAVAMVVGSILAMRLSARQIAVAVLVSQGVLAVASVMAGNKIWGGGAEGAYAMVGIFPHKNVLAQRMVYLSLAALAVIFASGYRPVWRPIAVGLLLTAAYLISQALSATGVILLGIAIPLAIIAGLFWRLSVGVPGMRGALVFGGIAAVSATLLVLLNGFGISPIEDALGAFGKDATLTGRTVIWTLGNEKIAENPLLGVGAGNFWVESNSSAVHISERFWNTSTAFSFHNSYYEVLVHLGVVGFLLVMISYWQAFSAIFRHWWRNQSTTDLFFLLVASMMLFRSLTESDFYSVKVLGPLLLWTGAFSAFSAQLRGED